MIKDIIKSNYDTTKESVKNHTRILNEYKDYLNECEDLKQVYNLQTYDMVFCANNTTFCIDELGTIKINLTFERKGDNFTSIYFRQGVIEYNKNLFYIKANQIKINCNQTNGNIIYKTDILNLKSKKSTSICGECFEWEDTNIGFSKYKKWWDIIGESIYKFKNNEQLRYVDLTTKTITKNVNKIDEEITNENMK